MVRQNSNAGWHPTRQSASLPSVVVDGWQQGYEVDGGSGPVTARFSPDSAYRAGLALGGILLLVALLLTMNATAIVIRNRYGRSARG